MHELSIAMSIVELAKKEAKKQNALQINEIEIDVGKFSGVDIPSLTFVLESIIQHTIMHKCRIQINQIEGKSRCLDCGCEFDAPEIFSICPDCQSYKTQLLSGRELKLKSLIID